METTTSLKTFEVTIPEKYADILKKFITSLEGKVKAQQKSGLDEALEDVQEGYTNTRTLRHSSKKC